MKKSLILTCVVAAAVFTLQFANAHFQPAATPVQTINVHDRYSIELPTYMTKAGDLNFEASLEYQNIEKEVYIIIIDESTDEFVSAFTELGEYETTKTPQENYARVQLESVLGNMSKITSESPQRKMKTQTGGAIVYDVTGFQDGIEEEMGFTVAIMQGKKCLYMIMTWTFAKNVSMYQSDMNNMISSFKEISGALDTYPHYFATDKYSVEVPLGLSSDTNACSSNCVGLSRAVGNLYVAITEFEKTEWKTAYKDWPDRKTLSLIEFFAMDQKNFHAKNAPRGTTHTELKKSKTNGATSCMFSRTEPAEGENVSWYYESLIVEGTDHFLYVLTFCPTEQLTQNRVEIDAMYASFKVKVK